MIILSISGLIYCYTLISGPSGMTGETEEGVSRERSHADCFFCACMHVAERSKCGEGTRRNAEKSRKGPAEVTRKEEKKLPL